MAETVRASAVTVRYGDRQVVSDLDWVVHEGERWVILGPNGAGKSSLLNLLATTTHPTRGQVEILGEQLGLVDVFSLRPHIGVVSGAVTARIPPTEPVRDVVLSAGYSRTGRWREHYHPADLLRCGVLLQEMGIAPLADRKLGTLSDGEVKRALVARALMPDPELLLLDEPAGGLDLGAREDLVTRLSHLARDEAAPVQVMITHHVEEIPPGFTHALLLRDGRPVASGAIDDVITAQQLSATFGTPLSVRRFRERFWAVAQ